MQTPVPGLVRWCTQAPISHGISSKQLQNGGTSGFAHNCADQDHKTEQLWSRLHLSVLQTVMDFPNLPGANQLELITLADMNRIVKDIVALIREAKNKNIADEPYGVECIEASVDRVVQILQVSLATGAFRCSLGKIHHLNNYLCSICVHYLIRRMGEGSSFNLLVCPHLGEGVPQGTYPPPARSGWGEGVPPKVPNPPSPPAEDLLHGGRYASYVHAGLSCWLLPLEPFRP